jgi:hypothetical protein
MYNHISLRSICGAVIRVCYLPFINKADGASSELNALELLKLWANWHMNCTILSVGLYFLQLISQTRRDLIWRCLEIFRTLSWKFLRAVMHRNLWIYIGEVIAGAWSIWLKNGSMTVSLQAGLYFVYLVEVGSWTEGKMSHIFLIKRYLPIVVQIDVLWQFLMLG